MNNIKSYSKRSFIALIVLFVVQACSDSLDFYPEDDVSDASYWKQPSDFKAIASDFYFSLKAWGRYDDDSDIITNTNFPSSISDGSYIAPETNGVWNDSYTQIRSANYLIEKAGQYEGDKNEISQYLGEARFFRAYLYFRLLKDFGGVPLILTPLNIDSEELSEPRATRDEVADQIVSDLEVAITNLPGESAIADADKGRISKEAAQGFMSRVALYEGTWQKFRGNGGRANTLLGEAVDAARAVINSGEYELFMALGDSSYKYAFIVDNNFLAKSNPLGLGKTDVKEFLIARRYSREFNISHGHSHALSQALSPTKKLADMYLCADGLPIDKSPLFEGRDEITSEYNNRDLRMNHSLMIKGNRYYSYGSFGRDFDNPDNPGPGTGIHFPNFGENTVTGYSIHKTSTENKGNNGGEEEFDYPVLRYAEVLLNYAEAKFELDGSISDADLDLSLNVVRNRGQLPALTNAFVSGNGLDMREEIRRERTVELVLEGFRLDDLKRWKTAEVEMPKAVRGVLYTGTEYETDPIYESLESSLDGEGYFVRQAESKRQFLERHYLFPIPTREVNIMGLKQNPDW